MSKKFDRQKVEAALKQAAKTAVMGSKAERSGRLLTGRGAEAPKVTKRD